MEPWGNNRKRAREGDEGREDLARGEKKKKIKIKNKKKQLSPPQITSLVDDDEDDDDDFKELDMDKLKHGSFDDDDDLSNTSCSCSTTGYGRMFDFPWLKEGTNSFKSEDYCQQLQLEDSFSSFNSNLFEASSSNHSAGPEFPGPQPNLCKTLPHHKIEEQNDLLAFKADELEETDWIWSSPMLDDQPPQLAANGFNKMA